MKLLTHIVLSAALVYAVASIAPVSASDIVEPAATPSSQSAQPADAATTPDENPGSPQLPCSTNWSAKDYKSFHNVQAEVKSSFGDVRILRIFLCGEGKDAYFRVLVMSGKGAVSRLRIDATDQAAIQ